MSKVKVYFVDGHKAVFDADEVIFMDGLGKAFTADDDAMIDSYPDAIGKGMAVVNWKNVSFIRQIADEAETVDEGGEA